jgi:hypothetical protein
LIVEAGGNLGPYFADANPVEIAKRKVSTAPGALVGRRTTDRSASQFTEFSIFLRRIYWLKKKK